MPHIGTPACTVGHAQIASALFREIEEENSSETVAWSPFARSTKSPFRIVEVAREVNLFFVYIQ